MMEDFMSSMLDFNTSSDMIKCQLLQKTETSKYFKETPCAHIMKLPYDKRCEFAMNVEDCDADLIVVIESFKLVFCNLKEEHSYIGIILVAITLISMFITISFLADGYICPNLAVMSNSLKLPHTIAGVTLLALGNGMPDLMTAYAGAENNHPQILFGSLTGGALFDITLAAGFCIYVRPFHIDSYCWWILAFYFCSYTILFSGFYYRNLTQWHCVCIFVIYIIYGIFTAAHVAYMMKSNTDEKNSKQSIILAEENEEKLYQLAKEKNKSVPSYGRRTLTETAEILKAVERSRIFNSMGFRKSTRRSADFGYSWKHPKHLFIEFVEFFDITKDEEWQVASLPMKIFIIMQLPWLWGLRIIIPVVLPEIHISDGWCKLLVMINMFIYPHILLVGLFDYRNIFIFDVPLWIIGIALGSVMSIFVFFFTRTYKKPKYHVILAVMGFVASIVVAHTLCSEIINNIQAIAARFTISRSFLALTVLAWGNSLTDFVSAISLSRNGMQNMGFSSLYGSPLFNSSIGFVFVITVIYIKGIPLKADYGRMCPVGSLFLFLAIVSTLVMLPALSFQGRRILGLYLILLYCIFFTLCFLMEDFIHSFTVRPKNPNTV